MSTGAEIWTAAKRRPLWEWWVALLGMLALVLYSQVLRDLVVQWWNEPDYSHGFLVPIFVGYLVWSSRDRWRAIAPQPSNVGLLLVALAVFLLVAGTLGAELFTSRVSLILLLAGGVLFLAGKQVLRVLAFPLCFLLLMVPLPGLIYNQVTLPLQLLASRFAAFSLTLLQVPVLRQGNLLVLPNYTLEVVDACSGIRSLMALAALAIGYGYLAESRVWIRVALATLMLPISVLSNGLRIVGTGVLTYVSGKPVAEGFFHFFSGWLIFLTATAMMIACHWALRGFNWEEVTSPKLKVEELLEGQKGSSLFDLRPSTTRLLRARVWITAAFLAGAIVLMHAVSRGERVPLRQPLAEFPNPLGEWTGREWPVEPRLLAASGVDDALSRVYTDRQGNEVGLYIGYYRSQRNGDVIHSPKNCLPATGWEALRATRITLSLPDGQRLVVNDYTVARGFERDRVFYWYQARGRTIASEYWGKVWLVADAITRDRTDCALIRLTTAETGEAESRARLSEFVRLIYPRLSEFVPD